MDLMQILVHKEDAGFLDPNINVMSMVIFQKLFTQNRQFKISADSPFYVDDNCIVDNVRLRD